VKCKATKRDGTPCTLPAMGADKFCWAHSPSNQEARKRGASKGGRNKPGTELHALKLKLITMADAVYAGTANRANAQVAANCYAVAIRAIEAELKHKELVEARLIETQLKVREQEELVSRLDELEKILEQKRGGGNRWVT
jgi:hypothetical protein